MQQTVSEEVARAFLQTVVVLDDAAYMGQGNAPGQLIDPSGVTLRVEADGDDDKDLEGAAERTRRSLNAEPLVNGFAAEGLVCGVLTAAGEDKGAAATLRAAQRADIVILDWHLGDRGENAMEIVSDLLGSHAAGASRVPMVVVYTATTAIARVREDVEKRLPEFEPIDRPGNVIGLRSARTVILFIRKGDTSPRTGSVSESDLPRRLVEEFAAVGDGILRNLALGGIAAIREDTHRVLNRFHSGMDGPFLTHRILLPRPEYADDYATELLGSELMSVLRARQVGRRYAGRDAIQGVLSAWEAQGREFIVDAIDASSAEPNKLSADEVMRLVETGPEELKATVGATPVKGKQKRKKLYETLYRLLATDEETGKAAHREFSRVSSLMREVGTTGTPDQAVLGLGSVVRHGNEYLLCVQPLCDAMRLKKDTQFVFSALVEDTGALDVVVRGLQGQDVCLTVPANGRSIRVASFAPDSATGCVVASDAGERSVFRSVSGEEFIWLCDLRPFVAQRFAHQLASNLSRVGLDEFEWQRRQQSGA